MIERRNILKILQLQYMFNYIIWFSKTEDDVAILENKDMGIKYMLPLYEKYSGSIGIYINGEKDYAGFLWENAYYMNKNSNAKDYNDIEIVKRDPDNLLVRLDSKYLISDDKEYLMDMIDDQNIDYLDKLCDNLNDIKTVIAINNKERKEMI
jgi:hypothetical protein